LQKLPHYCYRLINCHLPTVFTASGQSLPVTKAVELTLHIDGLSLPFIFNVSPNLSAGNSIILGMDFLTKFDCIINVANRTLSFYNNLTTVNMQNRRSGTLPVARLTKDTIVPARSEMIMPLAVVNVHSNENFELSPTTDLGNKCLAMARAIVQPLNGKINCRIINPSNTAISLKRHTVVGTLHQINVNSIVQFDSKHNQDEQTLCESGDELPPPDLPEAERILADLGINLSSCSLSDKDKATLTIFLARNADLFAKNLSQLGSVKGYTHHIDTGNSAPQRRRMYRASPAQKAEIDRQVAEMLDCGIIKPSNSLWQAPVVLVSKRSSDPNAPPPPPRFCVDFRSLNAVTTEIQQPLPVFDDVIDALSNSEVSDAKASIFSVLDFRSAFMQLPLDEESQAKASFVVHSGIYSFTRLPFGVRNGSVAFQSLMATLFRKMLFKYMICYCDDAFIYSPDFKTHLNHLSEIFAVLRRSGLRLHPAKCQFGANSVRYLSHILTPQGCRPCPSKIAAVVSYKMPVDSQKDLRIWLGMTQYWKRYIKDYAKICHPLNRLLRRDAKYIWTDECTKAFETLREKLTTAPILALPDFNKPFHITTDGSGVAIGAFLSQYDHNNIEHVIAYTGRSLRDNEKNFNTCDIEGLALVEAVRQFHVYIANGRFTVHTDNISLQYLNSIKNAKGRLLRWSLLLQGYSFNVQYKSAKLNPVADALSRRQYPESFNSANAAGPIEDSDIMALRISNSADDIQNAATPKPNERGLTNNAAHFDSENDSNEIDDSPINMKPVPLNICALTDLPSRQRECNELKPIFDFIENTTLPSDDKLARRIVLEQDQYVIEDDILYHLFTPRTRNVAIVRPIIKQLVVPISMRGDVLKAFHDCNFGASHQGFDRMFAGLRQRYHWRSMWADARNHCLTCDACQKAKKNTHYRKSPLVPIKPNNLWERWHIDYLKMPTVNGYTRLLVAVDSFSHWVEAWPVRTEKAEEACDILYSQLFARYGAPKIIVGDRSKTWMSQLIKQLCQKFEVKQHFTSAFHAMSNSVVERTNSSILNALRVYTTAQENWPALLPGALAALRAGICTHSSQFSPFHLAFNREMNLPIDNVLVPPTNVTPATAEYMEQLNKSIQLTADIATENIKLQQEKYKQHYDKNAAFPKFKVGDLVLLLDPNVPLGKSPKLHNKFRGPMYIVEVNDNFTYAIHDCATDKRHPSLVHANRLRPYRPPNDRVYNAYDTVSSRGTNDHQNKPDQCTNSYTSPPAISSSAAAEPTASTSNAQTKPTQSDDVWYAVEKLLATRVRNRTRQYRVKWASNESPTWQNASDISPALIREYHINRTVTGRKRRRPTRP